MSWSFFVRYLMSRRSGSVVRTIARIAIGAVGIGLASWVLVSSVMNGFNETIRVRHLSAEPHLLVRIPREDNPEEQREKIGALLKKAGIETESLTLASQQDVILRTYDGLFGGGVLKGLAPKDFRDFYQRTRQALQVGRAHQNDILPELSEDTWKLERDEVVVGMDLARSLGVFEGDPIIILPPETLLLPKGEAPPYVKFKVKSLLSTRLPDVDGQWIFFNREIKGNPLSRVVSREELVEVRLKDPYQDEKVESLLKAKGFSLTTWRERNKALFFALRLERWSMSLFLALSTLITCFAIISVLLLLIYQKRQEIGILMAMGLSPRKLKKIFIGIGLFLSLLGMGGGVGIGLVLSYILDRYPVEVLPDIYYDATIPASIEAPQVLAILFFSIVLALFASWLPVRWSLRESPSSCLRRRG
jgi:lipoprotein-releasing system permease protein